MATPNHKSDKASAPGVGSSPREPINFSLLQPPRPGVSLVAYQEYVSAFKLFLAAARSGVPAVGFGRAGVSSSAPAAPAAPSGSAPKSPSKRTLRRRRLREKKAAQSAAAAPPPFASFRASSPASAVFAPSFSPPPLPSTPVYPDVEVEVESAVPVSVAAPAAVQVEVPPPPPDVPDLGFSEDYAEYVKDPSKRVTRLSDIERDWFVEFRDGFNYDGDDDELESELASEILSCFDLKVSGREARQYFRFELDLSFPDYD